MTFVIPMAGKGSRFVKAGYKLPKYMISINGKTLFEYSMESLPLEIANKIVFICLEEHNQYNVSQFIQEKINHNNIKIIKLKEVTRGQAETVYLAKNFIDKHDDILIYNIDTAFKSKNLKDILSDSKKKKNGVIGAFLDKTLDDKWSFALLDNNKNVVKTTEKEKISNYALTGLYHFSMASDFFDIAQLWIENKKMIRNEFYIAPMYNDLIKNNKKYILDIVDEFIPLGTPDEVEVFEQRI